MTTPHSLTIPTATPPDHAPRMKRKSVAFVEEDALATVNIIESTQDLSSDEIRDTWYSRQDLQRLRRRCRTLANDLAFYSDEELFDRFGLRSIEELRKKQQRIQWAVLCVVKFLKWNDRPQEHCKNQKGLECVLNVCGGNSEDAAEIYFHISNACADIAMKRALRIEKQVSQAECSVYRDFCCH